MVDAEPYDKNEAYNELLSFLSTLESEKPMQEELEEEIAGMYQAIFCTDVIDRKEMIYLDTFEAIARHFYDLGCRRTAEKYDEIEYNRQRAEESVPKDLEEAADDFVWEVMENDEDGISDLCRKLRPTSKISDFYDALAEFFIAGAKWQKEQMMKEAVEGNVIDFLYDDEIDYASAKIVFTTIPKLKEGDKVRVIIVKEGGE